MFIAVDRSQMGTVPPRATVTHTRDALGRITTLDREDGIYALYSGGGIRRSFTYTSKGELETAQTSQLAHLGIEMPGRSLGFALLSQRSPGGSRQWRG